mmetsp:Transcript_31787/g.74237  ORF Transcript_31787/g.74237 Transcript_31787/m.74237 type:complete len:243 (+) Transcript_31787:112-840(+)
MLLEWRLPHPLCGLHGHFPLVLLSLHALFHERLCKLNDGVIIREGILRIRVQTSVGMWRHPMSMVWMWTHEASSTANTRRRASWPPWAIAPIPCHCSWWNWSPRCTTQRTCRRRARSRHDVRSRSTRHPVTRGSVPRMTRAMRTRSRHWPRLRVGVASGNWIRWPWLPRPQLSGWHGMPLHRLVRRRRSTCDYRCSSHDWRCCTGSSQRSGPLCRIHWHSTTAWSQLRLCSAVLHVPSRLPR